MSKISLTHRWQREGRLDAVRDWMGSERARLKGEGMSRAEAREAVWQAAAEQFPPSDESPDTNVVPTVPIPDDLEDSFDVLTDVKWVHQNLADPEAAPRTAGAFGMLGWARNNPDKFYQTLATKLLISEPSKEYDPSKQERREVEQLKDTYDNIVQQGLLTGRLRVRCPDCGSSFRPNGGRVSKLLHNGGGSG